MHTVFWLGNLKRRDHSEDTGVDWRIKLKWVLEEFGGGRIWTAYIWLRIEPTGGHL
jgi:hypothetical protein